MKVGSFGWKLSNKRCPVCGKNVMGLIGKDWACPDCNWIQVRGLLK